MSNISNQLIKDSYNYVLQSDLSTGNVYRIGGAIPVDPKFLSGLTVFTSFKFSDGSEQNGYVLTSDNSGNASWQPVGAFSDVKVTGFSYNSNTFTISDSSGNTFNATFNNVTGLTVDGNLIVTGNTTLTNTTGTSFYTNYIDFNNTLSPLPPSVDGRMYWDNNNGTVSLIMQGAQVSQQIGLEQYYYIKNQSGATIENGRVVRAAGTLGSSGRILGEYMIADGSIEAKFTLGIATEDINNGDDGYVTNFGLVRGIDTTGSLYGETWSDGSILWVSPTIAGGLTSIEPTAPNLKIEMAIVINAASNGSIFVRPTIYQHLYDLQEVNYSAGTENNYDILQWSGNTWNKTNTPFFNGLSATTISGTTFLGNGGDLTHVFKSVQINNVPQFSANTNTFINFSGVNVNIISGANNTLIFSAGTNDTFVTGFSLNNDLITLSQNRTDQYSAFTISLSAYTGSTGVSGDYLPLSGGTVTGGTIFTNGLTANTISATTYDNLPQIIINNTLTVALTGSTDTNVDFNSIKDALNSITGATSANTYTVKVAGGLYNEDPFTIPSWVSVVGESSISTIIQANDSSQTLVRLSDQSAIFDCQIQGCTDTGVSAVLYSSSTTSQSSAISYVENVRFGANYTHAKVVAYGGANIILQCSNVKYGGYPFTIGFYATNNTTGVGRMQLRNVTSTNGGIVTTSGLIFAKADAQSCGFIVNGCLLTKAVGAAAGTGFYVENGGFLRLTAVNFQRWSVGIDAPQIGSAPSIDAIALNFENNTIDVNIAHSGATGKIQGTDNFLKTIINQDAPLYEVNQDPKEITVAKKGGDFTSIKSAIDYLILSGNTSSTNRYIISVGPGEFTENEIDLTSTPYVSIVGSNIQTTLIKPSGNTQHIISIGVNNEVSFLTLSGAPSGYAGLYCYDIGDFAQAHKVSFYDCDTNVWIESNSQDTKFYGEYLDYNGEYTYGTKVIGNNGYLALANMENYYNFPTGSGISYCNYGTGSGATISVFVGDNVSNGISGTTAFYIQDFAELNASTVTIDGFTYGIRDPNIGGPVRFDIDNASIVDGEWDLYIESLDTFGTFGGSSDHSKIFTNSSDIYWSFLDITDGELDITRKASVTFEDGTHTDFTTLIFEGGTMGLMSGGSISSISAFTINTQAGYGYLETSADVGIVKRIDWNDTSITLSANTENYIFINENSVLSSSGSIPNTFYNILMGRVVTNSTGIEFIEQSPQNANHTSNRFSTFNRTALGPVYATGSIVTEGTTPFTLDVSAGDYFFSENQFMPSGGTSITFTQYYRDGLGGWITSATTGVTNSYYDGNGSLSGLTGYTKHTLYVVGDGVNEKYFLVLGQNEYSTLIQTESALLPTPPTYFDDAVTQIANIYVQGGTTGITQIEDIRPVIGFKAGGVNASSLHANLLGLSSDDHLQYLLVNGGRAMSGNLDMGTNDITNVNLVDGVDVSSHATRHQFGGSDPVGSTTPSANAIPYADVSGTLDSWITPITISGGTGILTGGTYPNFTITNTLPDQTVTISGGTGITTGGTYPNFTLVNSAPDQTVTISGGSGMSVTGTYPNFTIANTGETYVTGVTYSSNTLTVSQNGGQSPINTTIGLNIKSNSVAGASFAGNPKKFTVTFTTSYPNSNYSIGITGGVNRVFTYESKSATGFVINSNSNTAFTDNVDWQTIAYGES